MTTGTNDFVTYADGLTSPARKCAAVTPHDTNELTNYARALFVGVGGNIALTPVTSTTSVLFKNVPSGSILPVCARIVANTLTTATDIVALW